MKVRLDVGELGEAIVTAPSEAQAVARFSREVAKREMTYREHMRQRAEEAELRLWDRTLKMDDEGNPVVGDKVYQSTLIHYMNQHPDAQPKAGKLDPSVLGMPIRNVTINNIHLAMKAADECRQITGVEDVIDVEAESAG